MTDKSDASKWVTYPARGAVGILVCAAFFIAGRSFDVPGTTEFWILAAQPLATAVAGAGAIAAGLLALHNGAKTRSLDAAHHVDTMNRNQVSDFRGRYTTAANQIADTESAAIREAGIYAIGALADDWISYGNDTGQWSLARSQAQACINLLCSYLRANRYSTGIDPNQGKPAIIFPPEEMSVRASAIGVIRDQTPRWRTVEEKWLMSDELFGHDTFITLDLSGASLVRAQLAGADLREARLDRTNLQRANLTRANLSNASLVKADLSWARLDKANLSRTILHRTNFTQSMLTGAKFCSAMMVWPIFRQAHLARADFSDSSGMADASFSDGTLYSSETKWPIGFKMSKGKCIETSDEEIVDLTDDTAGPAEDPPVESV